jgi:cytochrome c553
MNIHAGLANGSPEPRVVTPYNELVHPQEVIVQRTDTSRRLAARSAKRVLSGISMAIALLPALAGAQSPESLPLWAYPNAPAGVKPRPDDGTQRTVPGSSASYTLTQVRDRFLAPDWHPSERPPMPAIVSSGRKPDAFACGFCHRADGIGGPENANLTGLPASYIAQQLRDFQSGARKSMAQAHTPQTLMTAAAKAVTNEEIEAASAYFASIKPRSTVRVVEAATAPKTYLTPASHLAMVGNGETEPLGRRIIEVPEDLARFESRDTHATFVAYVPPGSIAKGQALASGAGGKTQQCSTCHGPALKGLGPVPGIAGRSPTYMVRQLYDYKHGARAGAGGAPMKPVVEKLTVDEMIEVAAYVGSLAP